VFLETLVVIFRIAGHLHEIKELGRRIAAGRAPDESPAARSMDAIA
jgi:hypothetical protein